jgi:hypothetical protein
MKDRRKFYKSTPPRTRLRSLILLANPPLFFTQSNRRGTEPPAPNEPPPQTTAPAPLPPRRIAAHLGDASTPTVVMVVSTINTGPRRGGPSPPSAAAPSLPSTVAPPPLTAAPPPPTAAAGNPSCGMDEPTTFCPSGGGLMALLTAMDARHVGGPRVQARTAVEATAAAHVPRVEAPSDNLVPPLQPTSQDDGPGDGFHTPKKSPINPTCVSNVCYALFLFCFVM